VVKQFVHPFVEAEQSVHPFVEIVRTKKCGQTVFPPQKVAQNEGQITPTTH